MKNIGIKFRNEIKNIADTIFRNPETAFNEKKACSLQVDFLRKAGFEVENPAGGLDTAFKASSGKGGPAFCFMSEYDALEEKGHACGHHLISAAALAAGCAVADVIRENNVPGTVVVMGTPAEEGKGGKVKMLANGAFSGIDAALISHPFYKTVTESKWLAVSRFTVSFKGRSSHAGAAPQLGINALDAMTLFFNGINAWRQHIPEGCRVHGIIIDGGKIPNAIPDYTEAFFYIRAADEKTRDEMVLRFRKIAEGASLMTGAQDEVVEQPCSYSSNIYNKVFDDEYFRLASEAGLSPQAPDTKDRASSDFANVSQIMPCINLMYGITGGREYPLHSDDFRMAAGSPEAFEKAMTVAGIMAEIAVKYISDASFRNAVNQDFSARKR